MARKIAVVVTARPSYARVKTVLQAVQAHPDLELQLVVAASALLERYGNVAEVMRAEGFEAAMEVHMVVEGETPLTSTKTVGLGIVEMSNVLHHLRPAAVISVADRYETITTAISGGLHEYPGRPRSRRRGHRIHRREGAARGHKAIRPSLRVE